MLLLVCSAFCSMLIFEHLDLFMPTQRVKFEEAEILLCHTAERVMKTMNPDGVTTLV
jgi:hypothetical protein